jgi:hypothetical protein
VNEPHLQRVARADVSAGEDHVQTRLEANEARKPLRSSASGNEPELHFREAEHRFRRVGAHAVGARERRLEATAEARTADRGNDRRLELLESLQQRMPVAAQRLGLRRGLDAEELLDVGTRHPHVGLTTSHDGGTNRLVALEAVEEGRKLVADRPRERVDRSVRHVERHDGNAVADVGRERRCHSRRELIDVPRPSRTPFRQRRTPS